MPRQKLNRVNLHARVEPETPELLKQIANKLGYIYDKSGSTGQLLDAIASHEQVIIPKSLYNKLVDALQEISDNIMCENKKLSHQTLNAEAGHIIDR